MFNLLCNKVTICILQDEYILLDNLPNNWEMFKFFDYLRSLGVIDKYFSFNLIFHDLIELVKNVISILTNFFVNYIVFTRGRVLSICKV